MAANTASRQRVALRVTAAILAGYAFTWGFIAFGIVGLFMAGVDFHDAENLASLLGLLAFLVAFLWAFSEPRLLRVWLVLGGGGALMAAGASLFQSAFLPAT